MTKSWRMILVEDSDDDAALVLRELRRGSRQFDTQIVTDGPSLEAALAHGGWDVVISDYNLPKLDALQALDLVRRHSPHLPFILVSGTIGEELAVAALKAGAHDYVMKHALSRLPPVVEREVREARSRVRHDRIERALRHIAGELTTTSGELFFRSAVQTLQDLAGAQLTVLARINGDGSMRELARAVSDALPLTPSEDRSQPEEFFPHLFARAVALGGLETLTQVDEPVRLNGEAFHGGTTVILRDSAGAHLGLLGVYHRQTFDHPDVAEALVKIFSLPIAGELEREIAAAALRASEQRFRLLIENSSEIVAETTADGSLLYISPNVETSLGCSPPELVQSGLADRVHPADAPLWSTLLRQSRGTATFRVMHKNGSWRWFESSRSSFKTAGGAERSVIVSRDITEKKQAEEQIREQTSLLNQSQDATIVRDLTGQILFWSRGAERLYGWTGVEVAGKAASELAPPEIIAAEPTLDSLKVTGGWSGDLRQVTRAGKEFTVSSRWALVRDESGQPQSILITNTDITQRLQLEHQFLRVQRMESLGMLASGIAHDLNNIMAPILMSVPMLRDTIGDPDSQDMLNTIEMSVKRGVEITRQLLSFARGLGGEKLLLQPRHLVSDITKMMRETFPKNIRIQTRIAANLSPIVGDATQLHQVLLNLAVNARDAMPLGGTLTITGENAQLDETFASMHPEARPGPYVILKVMDTGTGIPPELKAEVFDPFFTTKPHGKGTGLGLFTVGNIMKSHAGFILLESEVNKGSTFSLYLPATHETLLETEPREPRNLPAGHGECILLVDDEQAVRKATIRTLTAHGYATLSASNGREGVNVFKANTGRIRLLIADLSMPLMDGVALVSEVRAASPDLPVIISSGEVESERLAQLTDLKVDRFLTKPYTAETMLVAIAQILNPRTPAA